MSATTDTTTTSTTRTNDAPSSRRYPDEFFASYLTSGTSCFHSREIEAENPCVLHRDWYNWLRDNGELSMPSNTIFVSLPNYYYGVIQWRVQ